jgi:hypothetical protein
VPVIVVEAEDFTAVRDPNNTNGTWSVVANPDASGGFAIKAPGGSRTDPSDTVPHDAIVEYDVAFNDPGTYFLYALVRGFDSGSNSLYVPGVLGDSPTVSPVALSEDGTWEWLQLAQYTIGDADVNRPLTLQLGKRERSVEIDRLLFSPVQLDVGSQIPEPGSLGLLTGAVALLGRRRKRI